MIRFLIRACCRRVVLWLVTTLVFVLFFVAPHDAARCRRPPGHPRDGRPDPQRLGLDQPVLVQYGQFLSRLLHGDLGYSYFNGRRSRPDRGPDLRSTASLVHRRGRAVARRRSASASWPRPGRAPGSTGR